MLARAVVSAKFAPLHQSVDMSDTETFQLDQRLGDRLPGKKRGRGAAVRRDRFMLALNDRLQSLSDPVAIQGEACRVLGEHLGCDWAHFLEFDEDATYALARSDYRREGAPSLLGRHAMGDFGPMLGALTAGHTLSERDVALSDLGTAQSRATYVALGLRAFAMAPIVRRGHLTASLVVCFRAPRDWTRHELQLIEETAARTADAA